MANVILPTGYETQVQTDMGVTTSILPDADVQSKATLAEALTKQTVPTYADITEGDELTFLQSACIAQLCALLCPGMPNRIKVSETSETGYAYKLADVDWLKKKVEFERAKKDFIGLATGGEVIMPSVIGVVVNERTEI